MPLRQSIWLSFASLVLLGTTIRADHAEARVKFAIKDGWVELLLQKDGAPVADALVKVIDEKGRDAATGETGDDGQAAFPMPAGSSLVVEIKIGDRLADPIRLYRTKAGVEPERVLLSYGLRPCCRGRAKSDPVIVGSATAPPDVPEEPSPWRWWWLVPVGMIGIAAAASLIQHREG
jgi:hypothetical protein